MAWMMRFFSTANGLVKRDFTKASFSVRMAESSAVCWEMPVVTSTWMSPAWARFWLCTDPTSWLRVMASTLSATRSRSPRERRAFICCSLPSIRSASSCSFSSSCLTSALSALSAASAAADGPSSSSSKSSRLGPADPPAAPPPPMSAAQVGNSFSSSSRVLDSSAMLPSVPPTTVAAAAPEEEEEDFTSCSIFASLCWALP
mmetsp:Transcript_70705/g.147246  ORF Transcript_70705/g.147246 Transcript_70705/m.147246 type:complete len:202 (+) Transcript_70705:288-893(+)